MRIAVTGGNGDLGRSLIPYLLEQGHAVVSLDRTLPPRQNPLPGQQLSHLVVDVRNYGELVAAAHGCDGLIHLAAHRSPLHSPDIVVHNENVAGSYNALAAAAALGITRVCLASSINAIGGVFSRSPRYDYFPLDEQHPCYAEDAYSLSKWLLEQQADAFARRHAGTTIASLRFHWLLHSYEEALERTVGSEAAATRHLWGYTGLEAAARACLLALTADFAGHEVFYIVAPRVAATTPAAELARQFYPATTIRGELKAQQGFFDCTKAARLLGWHHDE